MASNSTRDFLLLNLTGLYIPALYILTHPAECQYEYPEAGECQPPAHHVLLLGLTMSSGVPGHVSINGQGVCSP